MSDYIPAFTITALINQAAEDLELSVSPLGESQDVMTSIKVPAHDSVPCNLGFGPQEIKEYQPPVGYVFVNQKGERPFRTVTVLFDYKENPLVDIPIYSDYRSIQLSYLYHWVLLCNGAKIATTTVPEYKRVQYRLLFGENCKMQAVTIE